MVVMEDMTVGSLNGHWYRRKCVGGSGYLHD